MSDIMKPDVWETGTAGSAQTSAQTSLFNVTRHIKNHVVWVSNCVKAKEMAAKRKQNVWLLDEPVSGSSGEKQNAWRLPDSA